MNPKGWKEWLVFIPYVLFCYLWCGGIVLWRLLKRLGKALAESLQH